MGDEILSEIYKDKDFDTQDLEQEFNCKITEKDKFKAAKQILLGLAFLYVLTLVAYLIKPEGNKLVDICTITFPQLSTIILMSYFRDK